MQAPPPVVMLDARSGLPEATAVSLRYQVEHVSRYRYASRASACVMSLRLRPLEDGRQRLLAFTIETDPSTPLEPTRDGFGNTHHLLALHRDHDALTITARAAVEVRPADPLPTRLTPDDWTTVRSWTERFEHWEFTHASALARHTPALDAFVGELGLAPLDDPLSSVTALSDALHHAFTYTPGATTAESPIDDILATRRGVCQDYAHVMIAIARSWAIPARYVSGYLHVTGDDHAPVPGNAMHAWVECLLPRLGWIGFDPTNRSPADRHIRVAVGRDYRDVSPTRGVRQGGDAEELTADVSVRADGARAG